MKLSCPPCKERAGKNLLSFEQISLLCQADASQLVVVDIQLRLAAAMEEGTRQHTFSNTGLLLKAAGILRIPVTVTEQYPRGLGPTESVIAEQFPHYSHQFTKTSFSCCGADGFLADLDIKARPQIIVVGMEAHVCVLQTAVDLMFRGFQVFVIEDAVCSRSQDNHRNAMSRLRQGGVAVANTESVLFEWLRDAKHEHFKAISALLK